MGLIKGLVMSFGMFSIIPVPKNHWNDKYMSLIIPNLPLVGLLIGILWYGLTLLLIRFSIPLMIQSAVVLFIPLFLTGFIHADGYMDTADAVYSRRDLDTKKRILKDPNTGAFAVIAFIAIILIQFCAIHTILDLQKPLLVFAFIPAISRCVAGIALLNMKSVFESGYNASFKNNTKPRHTIFICLFTVLMLISAWLMLDIPMIPLLAGVITGVLVTIYLYKQFEGISGDLCGCIIVICEFAALLTLALIQ